MTLSRVVISEISSFKDAIVLLDNYQLQAFREGLLEAGKNKMQVVGAVMHKLIRVVFGVLKSGQPFDPDKLLPLKPNCPTNLA